MVISELQADTNIDPLQRQQLFMKVEDIQPAKWLIEGIAMEQGLTVLFGDKGVGKTTLSMQMLEAMKSGRGELFGLKTVSVPAFILEQDEPPRIFRNHRDRVLKELPLLGDMEIPRVYVQWDDNSKDFVNLVELIRAYPAKLVIIDSFTSLGIPDLNHPSTSAILDRLRQINSEEDVSFVLLHHVNKRGDILGSVTIEIKADNLIELDGEGLKFHKTRGEVKNLVGDTLSITRGSNILFNYPMSQRAKMLIFSGMDRDKVIETLVREYQTSRDSARATYDRALKSDRK